MVFVSSLEEHDEDKPSVKICEMQIDLFFISSCYYFAYSCDFNGQEMDEFPRNGFQYGLPRHCQGLKDSDGKLLNFATTMSWHFKASAK